MRSITTFTKVSAAMSTEVDHRHMTTVQKIARCSNETCHLRYAHSGPCDTRLFESERALRVMTKAASLAASRAERWENAYWNLLDHGGKPHD